MSTVDLPLPPIDLANRVGCLAAAADPFAMYEWIGRASREAIVSLLPGGWSFAGRRVLDFGCGAGRTLRHFAHEAETAEVWGCDIDEPSIQWLSNNLVPPFHVTRNNELPPLPFPNHHFDLVWAVSVFTHLTDLWSDWLIELHRVLRADGLLVATFLGRGLAEQVGETPWRDDRIGMTVLSYGQDWESGGPSVVHSSWWLRAHFGRAFEVLSLREDGFAAEPGDGQGIMLLKKKPVQPTREDLELPATGEPRELLACRHNLSRALREIADLRAQLALAVEQALHIEAHLEESRTEQASLQAKLSATTTAWQESAQQLNATLGSKSWRMTAPLRRCKALLPLSGARTRQTG